MKKSFVASAVAVAGLLVGVGLTEAHHAVNAQFDVTKSVTFEGVLTKVDWQNPHAWFYFDVKNPDGTITKWATETIGPNGLRRLGLSDRRLFKIGDTYKVEANPDRSGKNLGFTNSFTFPDGKYVKVGFVDAQGNAVAPPAPGAPAAPR